MQVCSAGRTPFLFFPPATPALSLFCSFVSQTILCFAPGHTALLSLASFSPFSAASTGVCFHRSAPFHLSQPWKSSDVQRTLVQPSLLPFSPNQVYDGPFELQLDAFYAFLSRPPLIGDTFGQTSLTTCTCPLKSFQQQPLTLVFHMQILDNGRAAFQ